VVSGNNVYNRIGFNIFKEEKFKGEIVFNNWKFEDKRPDEKITVTIKRHPIVLLKGLLMVLVVLGVMITVAYYYKLSMITFWDILIGLLIIAGILYYNLYLWYNDLYVLTDQRLIDVDQHSLFSRSVTSTALDQIQEVKVDIKGPLESILGYGKVMIHTSGPHENLVLEVTPKPFIVQNTINQAFHDYRDKVGITRHGNISEAKNIINQEEIKDKS